MSTVLVTGPFGQLGAELVPALKEKGHTVICIGHKTIPADYDGVVEKGDVCDEKFMKEVVEKHKVEEIYHLASLLSATGEKNPDLCWKVNIGSLRILLGESKVGMEAVKCLIFLLFLFFFFRDLQGAKDSAVLGVVDCSFWQVYGRQGGAAWKLRADEYVWDHQSERRAFVAVLPSSVWSGRAMSALSGSGIVESASWWGYY
jgi:hypothetical protein